MINLTAVRSFRPRKEGSRWGFVQDEACAATLVLRAVSPILNGPPSFR